MPLEVYCLATSAALTKVETDEDFHRVTPSKGRNTCRFRDLPAQSRNEREAIPARRYCVDPWRKHHNLLENAAAPTRRLTFSTNCPQNG